MNFKRSRDLDDNDRAYDATKEDPKYHSDDGGEWFSTDDYNLQEDGFNPAMSRQRKYRVIHVGSTSVPPKVDEIEAWSALGARLRIAPIWGVDLDDVKAELVQPITNG